MNWCPVEWPTQTPRPTLAGLEAKQSSKKAAKAALIGISVLIVMTLVVLGFALWSEKITIPKMMVEVKGFVNELVTGGIPVHLQVAGKSEVVRTSSRDVKELLKEQGIQLKPEDIVLPALTTKLEKNIYIEVIRVDVKKEYNNRAIPFQAERLANPQMDRGIVKKVKEGKEGLQREIWAVRYENGIEVARNCESKEVIAWPINSMTQYGTLSMVNRGGQDLRFNRAVEMLATGYTYTGKNTASGIPPSSGIAAVDPAVIPLGTRLYVEGYGKAIARDTGGAIKGNRIDLFYESENEALAWGKRNTRVYVLE
ncbi:3D domain-containing protein [Desulfotomaculum sp. 1211_IL3151]|uniref:3D domain-containing protein n=1 Tax=Desulfotomaculum sp. 1211_IL3151 TaxID=3084055 RepID=UPI002FD9922A